MKNMLPILEPGAYIVRYELGIRRKAGLTCERLQKHLKSGEIVQIEQVKYLRHSIWGKMKDGWVCMYMNQTKYLRKISK